MKRQEKNVSGHGSKVTSHPLIRQRRQAGIAIGYVLAVIALATLATFFLAKTQRGASTAEFNATNRTILIDQYTLIRSRIIGCVVSYPAGNNGTGFRPQYPATPVSTMVGDLTCPGQPGANNLWYGTGGLTLPAQPRFLQPWTYANDATNMRISITTTVAGDAAARGVMDSVVQRIGANATRSGDTLTIVLAI